MSSRVFISDGPPRSLAHAGARPNLARTARRSPSRSRTTASTGWVGAMFARPRARSETDSEIVIQTAGR